MDLFSYISDFVLFVNLYVIPFLIGIAFLFFISNVVRFFVLGGGNEESREKARSLALYSILAFVFILVFWGIVNMLTQSFNLTSVLTRTGQTNDCFDYMELNGVGCNQNETAVAVDAPFLPTQPMVTGSQVPSLQESAPVVPRTTPSLNPPTMNAPTLSIDTTPPPSLSPAQIETIASRDAASINIMQFAATSFIEELATNYDARNAAMIESAIIAVTDPNATTQEQANAAARIRNSNIITEERFADYIIAINTLAQQTGQPPADTTEAQAAATRLPRELLDAQKNNYETEILPQLELDNRGFFNFGAPNARAQAAGEKQLQDILQAPLSGRGSRLNTFDKIMIENGNSLTESPIAEMRSQLISNINAELFFNGQPPLTSTQERPPTSIPAPTSGSAQING